MQTTQFFCALLCGLLTSVVLAAADLVQLPEPSFDSTAGKGEEKVLLKVAASKPNKVVDDDVWFSRYGMEPPSASPSGFPAGVPMEFGGAARRVGIVGQDEAHYIGIYGDSIVVGFDEKGAVRFAFGFGAWQFGPAAIGEEAMDSPMELSWAQIAGDRLFVALNHYSYAKTTGGQNGYLASLKLPSGELEWLSDPLVSNARNFLVKGGYLVCGYGFTEEPDFVYVLEARTGKIVQRQKVKSGPSHFLDLGQKIAVRCYDTDYELEWLESEEEPRAGEH